MCMTNDWDSQVLRTTRRKARKEHRCAECRKRILPDEHYIITATLMDGSVDHYKNCLKCDKIAAAHFAAERALGHDGGSYTIGELVRQVRVCITEEAAYVGNFRKAWRGETLPRYVRPPDPSRTYASVNV